ncbi:glutamate--cysteine ligase 2 [Nocardia africana]|uniref:Putative glutamate--cysteine ligase 2 n=1 Tax=Nocardia africana TaxID=134964 RepID=A0A378WYY7_9NOCA|nr:glutamate--cysteine ligase [Nocardia africana]MCC3312684.1 glutamate--cysteine ligase [Nocardia africana]SUA45987.1 Carboxylate-amine ligase YbdK [Nocardia africana]
MDAADVTLGVEEEFLLVDPVSGAPVAKNCDVARSARDAGIDLQLELTSCQVETSSSVHTRAADLLHELRQLRGAVVRAAADNSARLLATAVPPTVPHAYPVTDTPRYRRIEEHFGMLAHEQGLCGCHVHVSVDDPETAVQISNHLRPWLPVFLSLTANSAVYRGTDTGYASWRNVLWRRWPSAGPPPYFDSCADYDAAVELMLTCGSILDTGMVYWDIRRSMHFPTLEIRISDVPVTAEESALLASLVRAAAVVGRAEVRRGRRAPAVPAATLRAAYWKSAREGLDGDGVDPLEGRVEPARIRLARLVEHVAPALRELEEEQFVTEMIAAVTARGNGARRQSAALRRRGAIADVVDELAEATADGCSV